MIGPVFDYNMVFLGPRQYVQFLSKLPYTLSANYGGYLILVMLLLLVVWVFRRHTERDLTVLLSFVGLLLLSLVAIFPVSYPLYGTIRVPGTWYRIVFLPDMLAIIALGYFSVRYASERSRLVIAFAVLIVLVPGLQKTRDIWASATASAEREGMFYLDNPDKVLLSEQAAWWFIPGVHRMYHVEVPHYVLVKDLREGHVKPSGPVWRFKDGKFISEYPPVQP
jgi:hypothetical protein